MVSKLPSNGDCQLLTALITAGACGGAASQACSSSTSVAKHPSADDRGCLQEHAGKLKSGRQKAYLGSCAWWRCAHSTAAARLGHTNPHARPSWELRWKSYASELRSQEVVPDTAREFH